MGFTLAGSKVYKGTAEFPPRSAESSSVYTPAGFSNTPLASVYRLSINKSWQTSRQN